MQDRHELDSMFYPKSVAIVGASPNPGGFGGTFFLTRIIDSGFSGAIYPVNSKAPEVQGFKAYPDMKSLPEPVDFVIIATPAGTVPQILEDCITAGVKNVHIFTSGFGETGEEEGRRLEEKITEIIRRGGLQVVGPNCMGIYVPASKLTGWGVKPEGTGSIAFVSQSGGHGEFLTGYAQGLGINFSKIISYGNASGLQAVDFLEYLADDPDTSIITMYLEGIEDGSRFTQLVRTINRIKPVLIWKGGLTESGSRAVVAHTGSLAGEGRAWDAFFAQTGAIRVFSLEDILDVAMAFYLTPPRGRRVLLLGGGGGNSVAAADICDREGLEVPRLSEKTQKELNAFIRLAGNSVRNPLDVWEVMENIDSLRSCMELAVADPVIDVVIVDRHVGNIYDDSPTEKQLQQEINDFIIEFAQKNTFNKTLVMSTNLFGNTPEVAASAVMVRKEFATAGVPAYSSQVNAARALSRLIKYHEFQAANQDSA